MVYQIGPLFVTLCRLYWPLELGLFVFCNLFFAREVAVRRSACTVCGERNTFTYITSL